MQTIIILPNYSQSDEISVLYSKDQEWKLTSYSQVIPSLKLPKGCGRGIPAPVLRAHSNQDFVLGQLIFRPDTKIALRSCNAGKDTTGRSVFITAIIEGVETDNFYVTPACLDVAKHSDVYPMDDTQKQAMEDAITRLNAPSDESAKALNEMWENAIKNRQYSHFTSVSFEGVSYLPDSEKAIFENKVINTKQVPDGGSSESFENLKKKQKETGGKNKNIIYYIIFIVLFIFALLISIEIIRSGSSSP